jgi:hypothetical protein
MAHPLLEKLLFKKGIKSTDELSPEEHVDFERWQATLVGDISVDSILQFCDNQVKLIDSSLRDINAPSEKIVRLNLQRNVYATVRDMIAKPSAERESLEKYLNTLLES